MYQPYNPFVIWARRCFVLAVGISAFPCVALIGKRAPFYSALHLFWIKCSNEPAWMTHAKPAQQQFF
jgi:hypothetical protein